MDDRHKDLLNRQRLYHQNWIVSNLLPISQLDIPSIISTRVTDWYRVHVGILDVPIFHLSTQQEEDLVFNFKSFACTYHIRTCQICCINKMEKSFSKAFP